MSKQNHNIVKKGLIVASVLMMARCISFFKEMKIASTIGLGSGLDQFIIAFVVVNFILRFIFNTLAFALIPEVSTISKDNIRLSLELFHTVLMKGLLLLLVVLVALFILSESVFKLAFSVNFKLNSVHIHSHLFQLFPFMIFFFMGHLGGHVLSVLGKKIYISIIQLFPALAIIGFLYFEIFQDPIHSVLHGYNIGIFLYCLICFRALWNEGYRINLDFNNFSVKSVFKEWKFLILSEFLISINLIVDVFMASILEVASVSTLDYGIKIYAAVVLFAAMLINIICFPRFSELKEKSHVFYLKKVYQLSLLWIFLISGFVVLIFTLYDEWLIQILFERGAFEYSDTINVAKVNAAYMIGLFFQVGVLLSIRLFNALRKNNMLLILSGISVVFNVILNILLVDTVGLVGIAYSSTMVSMVLFIILLSVAFKYFKIQLAQMPEKELFQENSHNHTILDD